MYDAHFNSLFKAQYIGALMVTSEDLVLCTAEEEGWCGYHSRDVVRGAFPPLVPSGLGEEGLTLANGLFCALFCAHGLCMANWST